MTERKICIEYCRNEADKFKGFISDHEGDRKYADLIPYWKKNAEMYDSITAHLEGAVI